MQVPPNLLIKSTNPAAPEPEDFRRRGDDLVGELCVLLLPSLGVPTSFKLLASELAAVEKTEREK